MSTAGKLSALDVYIADHRHSEHLAGRLYKQGNRFAFQYAACAQSDISLTMPRRAAPYFHSELHPIFQMHLPEGPVREMLEQVIAKAEGSGDLSLLQSLSDNQYGRLRYASPDQRPNASQPKPKSTAGNVDGLAEGLFAQMLMRYAKNSAQASVQPRINTSLQGKATLPTPYYIIKSWGDEYPELACNEYACLELAKAAGLHIPKTQLGDRGKTVLSHRIDKNADGLSIGFEDFAVLQAKGTAQRYDSSLEACAKTIRQFVSPRFQAEALGQLFMLSLVNVVIRNGDAHLKNLAITYPHAGERRLGAFFDLTTTCVYLPDDFMALSLNGSKQWPDKSALLNFGVQHCMLKPQQVDACFAHMQRTLIQGRAALYQLCQTRAEFQPVAEKMEAIWADSWQQLDAQND